MNLITRTLTTNEQQAVNNLIEHIGEFNFKISSLLKAINGNQLAKIQKEWMRWAIVDGKVDAVQSQRRQEELALFLTK